MTEPLLRDRLDDLGRELFAAADEERPGDDAREALVATLLAATAGTAATAGALAAATAKGAAGTGSVGGSAATAMLAAKWLVIGVGLAGTVGWAASVMTEAKTARPVATAPATAAPPPTASPTPTATPAPTEIVTQTTTSIASSSPKAKPAPAFRNTAAKASGSSQPATETAEAPADERVERAPTLGDQVRVLDRARASLRKKDRARALEALDEFDRRFERSSTLAPEAAQIRAAALRLTDASHGLEE